MALLWLNDRLGNSVTVSVEIERSDLNVSVVEVAGELSHRTETSVQYLRRSDHLHELHGHYVIGEGFLDLGDVHPLEVKTEADHLRVRLDEHISLEIRVQEELAAE